MNRDQTPMFDEALIATYRRRPMLVAAGLLTAFLGLVLMAAPPAVAQAADGPPAQVSADGEPLVKAQVSLRVTRLRKGRAPITGRVVVKGEVKPWRPSQRKVHIRFYRDGKRYMVRKVKMKKGAGDFGTFSATIATKKGSRQGAHAVYFGKSSPNPVRQGRSPHRSWKVSYPSLSYGQCGRTVRGFRTALNRLAIVPGGGSCFNGKMQRAVLGYRKLNGMSRNATAPASLVKRVFNGKGGYRVRKPSLGDHVEAPLHRQVLVFAKGSRPYAIFPIASGKASTPTILGTYSFYRKDPGYNAIGMYYSSYFIRGYAIHGYASVPNYPASHGCLRTFISDQPRIYGMTRLGQPIYTFGNAFASGTAGDLFSGGGDLGPDLGPAGGLDPAA